MKCSPESRSRPRFRVSETGDVADLSFMLPEDLPQRTCALLPEARSHRQLRREPRLHRPAGPAMATPSSMLPPRWNSTTPAVSSPSRSTAASPRPARLHPATRRGRCSPLRSSLFARRRRMRLPRARGSLPFARRSFARRLTASSHCAYVAHTSADQGCHRAQARFDGALTLLNSGEKRTANSEKRIASGEQRQRITNAPRYHVPVDDVTAFILAGGRSSRMGSDKALLSLGEQTLLRARPADCVCERLPNAVIVGPKDSLSASSATCRRHLPGLRRRWAASTPRLAQPIPI